MISDISKIEVTSKQPEKIEFIWKTAPLPPPLAPPLGEKPPRPPGAPLPLAAPLGLNPGGPIV